jgi:hypothetical protein
VRNSSKTFGWRWKWGLEHALAQFFETETKWLDPPPLSALGPGFTNEVYAETEEVE